MSDVCSIQRLEARRLLSAGLLDPTLAGGGACRIDLPVSWEIGRAMLLLEDGRVLLGGTANSDFALVRLHEDGTRDASFGNSGVARTNVNGADDAIHALALQSGSILAAGAATGGAAIVRYSSSGILDTTFATGGRLILPDFPIARDILVDAGGFIIAGESGDDAILMRFLPDGSPDISFGTDGVARTTLPARAEVRDLAFDGQGRILLAGGVVADYSDNLLMRYTAAGALDGTFGAGGIVITDIGGSCNYGHALALQDDGRIIVAGETCSGSTVARFDENGAIDASFGTLGAVNNLFGSGSGRVFGVAVQEDGRIVIAGASADDHVQFVVGRLETTGALDATFGENGLVFTQFDGKSGDAAAIALQPNGRILAAGSSDYAFALARYTADPSDADFDRPLASATPSPIVAPGGAECSFLVQYSPDIDPTTIGDDDLAVTGPNGFTAAAELVSIDGPSATYRFAAPGGAWSSAANGDYALSLQRSAVRDLAGNGALPATIGTLRVVIPQSVEGGRLSIAGTAGRDSIRVGVDDAAIVVTVNGVETRYLASSVQELRIAAGGGDDTVVLGAGVMGARIDGGAGNDRLYGGDGNDLILGGKGNDRLYGRGGSDRLLGQDGDDLLDGGAGADVFSGGRGADTASYASRTEPLRLSVDKRANDGAAGEADNIAADVERLLGGKGDDILVGRRGFTTLKGGAGRNRIVWR